MMKKLRALLIIINSLLIIKSYGSHATGAELTYTCLGNDQYEFTYILYNDCVGIDPPIEKILTIKNSCGFPIETYLLPRDNTSGQLINPLCSTALSTCNGGTAPGIERWVYRGTVSLAAECSGWYFSVYESSRNASITTLEDPDAFNLYVSAMLNNTNQICNNSPLFNIPPVFFTCVNESICIDPGITEVDGDIYIASLGVPVGDDSHPLTYQSGYSQTQFLTSSIPITFDSVTGRACLKLQLIESGPQVLTIFEFRNGILIGSVQRDIQIYVNSCTDLPPVLSGIDNTTSYDLSVCSGDTICFEIFSDDPNSSDSTFISWDSGIPDGSFTITPGVKESGQFCWQTIIGDTLNNPRSFEVTVRDNGCPHPINNRFIYNITLHDDILTCLFLSSNDIQDNRKKFEVYPQPAINVLNIIIPDNIINEGNVSLQLFDLTGHEISSSEINHASSAMNVSEFSSGIYLLKVMNGSQTYSEIMKVVFNR